MVHNFDTPLTQEHAIEEIAKEPPSSKDKPNYKKRKSNNEEKISIASSVGTEQTTNIISDDKFFIERLLETTIEVETVSNNSTSYKINNSARRKELESPCRNEKPARAYRHLRAMSRLEETSFWMKTELTADYQGSTLVSASNEYYGSASNMIKTTVDNDVDRKSANENEEDRIQNGWLVKRHEEKAHAIIQLGVNGKVQGVDISTIGYSQSAPLKAALYGRLCDHPKLWTRILPAINLKPDSHNFFETKNNPDVYDQILITLVPGGGIHRLRVFGDVVPPTLPLDANINLSSTTLGAQIVQRPLYVLRKDIPNLLLSRSDSSQDGWICPRDYYRSTPQYTIVKLASEGIIERFIVDTTHFIGNAPKHISLEGCCITSNDEEVSLPKKFYGVQWVDLLEPLDPTYRNIYPNMLHIIPCVYKEPLTHVRIRPIPDGGIQQMIIKGKVYQRDQLRDCDTFSNNCRKRKYCVEEEDDSEESSANEEREIFTSTSTTSTTIETKITNTTQ